MTVSLIDKVKADIVRQANRVLIGFPSDPNRKMKATGLHFSSEYYYREAANIHRSEMHRLVAQACSQVLTDKEVHELMAARLSEIVNEMAEKNGLKVMDEIRNEEAEQAKNDEKVQASVKKVAKVIAKAKAKPVVKAVAKPRNTSKPVAKTVTKTTPKTATRTTAKPRAKASASK